MKRIGTLAMVVNAQKNGALELADTLTKEVQAKGIQVNRTQEHPIPQDFLSGHDACCVIGGDGTLLGTVEQSVKEGVPVFGINQGKLGFMATVSRKTLLHDFNEILSGNYQLDQRQLLDCTSAYAHSAIALNDMVIKNRDRTRLIELEVRCDKQFVTTYNADGLIFSTPTGSTAYNLSAGGPIIHPGADVIAMTPICPHTLSNRSVIFADEVELHICCRPNIQTNIAIDGRELEDSFGLPLTIKLHDKQLPLLHPPSYSHFHVLRTKLDWGGEPVSCLD